MLKLEQIPERNKQFIEINRKMIEEKEKRKRKEKKKEKEKRDK